jgi:hypothetical protein
MNRLEEIWAGEIEKARQAGERYGYLRGLCFGLTTTVLSYLISLTLLSQKLGFPQATNFTQCPSMWPEEACRAYCNSPTLFR